jgi:hypothetical protein
MFEGDFDMGVISMVRDAFTGDNVGDLVGQIDQVRAKGVAAHAKLERLEAARLVAEDYDAAVALGERIARVTWETDRLAALLPQLEERLGIARNAKQKDAIARHAAINRKSWPRFRAAMRPRSTRRPNSSSNARRRPPKSASTQLL